MKQEYPACISNLLRTCGGGSLIEVMIGIVILLVLAVAGGTYLVESRGILAVHRNKATALAVATGRMEALRSTYYVQLTNGIGQSYALWYLRWHTASGYWEKAASDSGETALIGGMSLPMRTTIQFFDMDGGWASYDALRARVQVGFKPGSAEVVELDTLLAP